jgi:hypothetical protein
MLFSNRPSSAFACTVAQALRDEADAMHAMHVLRADKIEGSTDKSEEEKEFGMLCKVIEAYGPSGGPTARCQAARVEGGITRSRRLWKR